MDELHPSRHAHRALMISLLVVVLECERTGTSMQARSSPISDAP